MAWYYMNSVGIANGGTVVSVTGGVDLSQIKAGWMFSVGSMIAEVKSGTAPDGSGNSTIILERAWEGVTATAQTGLIAPTSGALLEALAGLENTNAFAIATHKALSDIATLDIDVTITDSAGNSHTFASMPKNARLIQELLNSSEYASLGSSAEGDRAAVIASDTSEASGSNSVIIGSVSSSVAAGDSATVISSVQGVATANFSGVLLSNASTASGLYASVISSQASTTSGRESSVIASDTSAANGNNTAVLASTGSTASAEKSAVIASQDGTASGLRTMVLSSYLSTASGPYSNVIGSYASNASAATSNVIGSTYCSTGSSDRSSIISSRATSNATSNSLSMGYHAVDALPIVANQSIRLEANGGVGRFAGGTTTTGFDYAEYFENINNETIPAGTIITLEGNKVRKALPGEFILGAVSKTYGVLGNSPDFCWHKRYLKDEYGGYLAQGVECINDMNETRVQDLGEHERIDSTVKITNVYVYDVRSEEVKSFDEVEKEVQEIYVVSPAKVPFREITATRTVIIKESVVKIEVVEFILIEGVETPLDGFEVIDGQVTITEVKEYDVFIRQDKIENPDYEDKPYSSRGDRPDEYTIVGLLGQLYVTVKEDITAAYVGADGLGTDDETPLRAMKMTTPFDSEKGYGVCFCYKK